MGYLSVKIGKNMHRNGHLWGFFLSSWQILGGLSQHFASYDLIFAVSDQTTETLYFV